MFSMLIATFLDQKKLEISSNGSAKLYVQVKQSGSSMTKITDLVIIRGNKGLKLQVTTAGVGANTNEEIKKYLRAKVFKSASIILQEGAESETKVFKIR
jgi:uncharacterized protein YggU (UPF0235/DUF167 family)